MGTSRSFLLIVYVSSLCVLYLVIQLFYNLNASPTFLQKDLHKDSQDKSFGVTAQWQLKYDARLATTSNVIVNNCTQEFKNSHFMTWAPGSRARTGNRLFQLATLIATAKTVCYTPVVHHQKVSYIEEIFDLQNVKRINLDRISFRTLHEAAAGIYDVNLTSQIDPAYNWTLKGFRQSFKYFEEFADLIKSSFKVKEKIQEDVLHYISSFEKDQIKVGLHVRRGDFRRQDRNEKGYSLSSIDYINRAIAYVKERLGQSKRAFLVVSDGLKWCKQHIKGVEIHYSPFDDPGRDLYLLTQCDHNIFTSGTFGWMGAWLNETGLVVYDKSHPIQNSTLWKTMNQDDYYPSRWTGI